MATKSAPRESKSIVSWGAPWAQSINTREPTECDISTMSSMGLRTPRTLLMWTTQTSEAPSSATSKASMSRVKESVSIGTYLTSTPLSIESCCHGTMSA